MPKPNSSSAVQQKMESIILQRALSAAGLQVPGGGEYRISAAVVVKLDALDVTGERPLLCEAWSHIGKPKSAQKDKVLTDALKLLLVEKTVGRECEKVFVFADNQAAAPFVSDRTWQGAVLKSYGFRILIADLTDAERQEILAAQDLQARPMRGPQ